MIKEIENTELQEALTLLDCYEDLQNTVPASVLEDINEEVHSTRFLKLISENNEHDI
ncbi:hypothetical protein [uncultured Clostridium sp.]|jgi:hypothetical protein|uniref:hypothetical protein n=1 Tax=uncultured Clostridium sp. TaxID=59620 RepID=UPI002611F3DF|nr:hypothetical protein [uncultured Clostridium sp.]